MPSWWIRSYGDSPGFYTRKRPRRTSARSRIPPLSSSRARDARPTRSLPHHPPDRPRRAGRRSTSPRTRASTARSRSRSWTRASPPTESRSSGSARGRDHLEARPSRASAPVYETGEDRGVLWIAMRYVEGDLAREEDRDREGRARERLDVHVRRDRRASDRDDDAPPERRRRATGAVRRPGPRSRACSRSSRRPPARSTPPTRSASSIATSSPATSW